MDQQIRPLVNWKNEGFREWISIFRTHIPPNTLAHKNMFLLWIMQWKVFTIYAMHNKRFDVYISIRLSHWNHASPKEINDIFENRRWHKAQSMQNLKLEWYVILSSLWNFQKTKIIYISFRTTFTTETYVWLIHVTFSNVEIGVEFFT